jgi:IS30 family transposase
MIEQNGKKRVVNITVDERNEIARLVAEGGSMESVARAIGRSVYAVQRVVFRQRNAVETVTPWRCGGCGRLITFTTCLACRYEKMGRRGAQDTDRVIRGLFRRGYAEGYSPEQIERAINGAR